MKIIKIETSLPDGEDITLTRTKKLNEYVPAYTCIGGNMEYQTRENGYPELFSVLKDLSSNSTWFFWSLMEKRNNKTNIAIFKAINPTEAKKVTKAFKELSKLQLIKRVSRQHYLFNPKVVLPNKGEYNNVLNQWSTL